MSSSFLLVELEARVKSLQEEIAAIPQEYATNNDANVAWLLLCAVFVFLMQVGFAMLEVGSVSNKNTKAVLIKNMGDACIGAISWWLLGYGFAYGSSNTAFIGTNHFALHLGGDAEKQDYDSALWFYSFAFVATSATIVSGAVAERVKIVAYIIYSIVITSFIYPVVVHWIWYEPGWASALREDENTLLFGCGAVDFAGSSVVHMIGGSGAFTGAWMSRPRSGKYDEGGAVNRLPMQSPSLQTLGALVLWCGWYAFNGGSALTITNGRSAVAADAMISTTIAPAASALTVVLLVKFFLKKFDSNMVNNGILCGLVSVTAGCALVAPEGAFIIGVGAGCVYFFGSWLVTVKMQIDDVVDATAVHLLGGMWGMFAAGLFTTESRFSAVYDSESGHDLGSKCAGVFYGGGGHLLAAQIIFELCVLVWGVSCHLVLFAAINATVGLRVSPHIENGGLDQTKQAKRKQSDALTRAMSRAGLGCHVVSVSTDVPVALPTTAGGDPLKGGRGGYRNSGAASMAVGDAAICQPEVMDD